MFSGYFGKGWVGVISIGVICLLITASFYLSGLKNHFPSFYIWIMWVIWVVALVIHSFVHLINKRKNMRNKWNKNTGDMANSMGTDMSTMNDNSMDSDMSAMMNNLMKGRGIPTDFFNGNMPSNGQNKTTKKININGKEISHECNGDPNCSECKKIDNMMKEMMGGFKF